MPKLFATPSNRCAAASVLAALAMAFVLAWIGPTHTALAPWDVIIHFDESWRLYGGQHSHVDFINPAGSFAYWLTAVGMHLVGPSAGAIVVANIIFLMLATAAAVFVAYRRLPAWEAFGFTLFVILLASAMTQIGRPAHMTGYVEVYNRYAWTLSCVLFLQAFLPVRAGLALRPVAEGVIAAVLLSLIVYTKASFGVIGALALLTGIILHGRWRDMRFMGALVGGGVVCIVAAWVLMGVNIFAYIADVLGAAAGQTAERRGRTVLNVLKRAPVGIAFVGLIWVLLVALAVRAKTLSMKAAIRISLIAALMGVFALLIAFGNTGENGELPLLTVIGLFLLNETRTERETWDWSRIAAAAILVLAVAGPIALRDARSIVNAAGSREYRLVSLPESQRFQSGALGDFVIPHTVEGPTEFWGTAQVPGRVNDGLALIRAHAAEGDTVFALAFSNPFPIALGWPSPRGAPIWFEHGLNFNDNTYYPAERIFADAKFVIIPIITDEDVYREGGRHTADALVRIYGPYLEASYDEVGRSSYWILMERRGAPDGA